MIDKESDFEELLESAYKHTIDEVGLEKIKPSLKMQYDVIQKAHNSIHEFMFLATRLVPTEVNDDEGWHGKSAFLIYHLEVFNYAHRSVVEALCAYYNVAFVLLRVTLELLIKGAFWECLSHKKFREKSKVLDQDKRGKKIKDWLNEVFKSDPNIEIEFERISGSIYDKISPIAADPKFRLDIKTIIQQLDQWEIFNPVIDPTISIYKMYYQLSLDVHIIPDRTDFGKRLLNESNEIFDQTVSQKDLSEYIDLLHQIMDLAILIELNIFKDNIENYDEVKTNLRKELENLEQLGLNYSLKKSKELLNSRIIP